MIIREKQGFSASAAVIIVALIALVIWAMVAWQPVELPADQATDQAVEEVENLDLGDLDSEFEAIDADLNRL